MARSVKQPKFKRPELTEIAFPGNSADYRPAQIDTALNQIFAFALEESRRGIDYYERQAMLQGGVARIIRGLALVLFIAGTLAPIITTLILRLGASYTKPWEFFTKVPLAEIGYTLLAVAGGLVIFDQFFGYSSSWIRFRQTQTRLEVMESQFRAQWASRLAAAGGNLATPGVVVDLMALATTHVTGVAGLYEAETREWAEQFRAQLASFDQRLQAAQEAAKQQVQGAAGTGGGGQGDAASAAQPPLPGDGDAQAENVDLRLAFENFEELDKGSLVVTVDGAQVDADTDGFVALSVSPGLQHTIVATAQIEGAAVQGELNITPTLDDDEKAVELKLEPVS